jgi:hypothetical protein
VKGVLIVIATTSFGIKQTLVSHPLSKTAGTRFIDAELGGDGSNGETTAE